MSAHPQSRRYLLVTALVLVMVLASACQPSPTPSPTTTIPTAPKATVAPTLTAPKPTEAPTSTVPKPAEVVNIEFLHPWGGTFGAFIGQLVDQFNASQSAVKVTAIQVGSTYEEILTKVQARIATNDPPDLSIQGLLYTNYVAENVPYVSMQEFVNDSRFDKADVPSSFLALGQYKGEQVALPFSVSTPVLFYNADLFRAAGLDPAKPPKTWDDVRTYAQALSKDTNNDGEIDQFGVYFQRHVWYLQCLVESAGGALMEGDEIAFNQEPGIKSLEYQVELQNKKLSPQLTSAQAQASFTAGTLGMYIATSAFAVQVTSAAKFEVRAAPFPYLVSPAVAAGGANVWVFSKDTKRRDAAFDFVRWLTSKEGTTIIAKGTGYMPIRNSVLTDPKYMGDFLKEKPLFTVALEQVGFMSPWQNFPGGPRIPALLLKAWEESLAGSDPKAVLDAAAVEAAKIVAEEK